MKEVTIDNVRERIKAIASRGNSEYGIGLTLKEEFELACLRQLAASHEREKVRALHASWSQETFGNVGPIGPLKHLAKEAMEAAAAPGDISEWADMQFLLWDAQRRAGITDEQITQAMIDKLAVNKARTWQEPKDGEPRLHVKEQPAPVEHDSEPSFDAMMRALDAFYADDDVPERAMLAAFKILLADVRGQAQDVYNIGDATMRHIFTPTGMTNVSDMQAVFDRVETVLAGMEQPAPVVVGELGFIDHFERIISERDDDIDISQLGNANYDALMLAALDAFRAAMHKVAEPAQATDNTAQQFEALATSNTHDCLWSYDSHQGTWHGKCGVYWVFMDDGPDENGMKFCPGCGKTVATTSAGSGKQ